MLCLASTAPVLNHRDTETQKRPAEKRERRMGRPLSSAAFLFSSYLLCVSVSLWFNPCDKAGLILANAPAITPALCFSSGLRRRRLAAAVFFVTAHGSSGESGVVTGSGRDYELRRHKAYHCPSGRAAQEECRRIVPGPAARAH